MSLQNINSLQEADARVALLRCCGSTVWAEQMTARRPYASVAALLDTARNVWRALRRDDWLEAFAAHPKIGDLDALRSGSGAEQAKVAAAPAETLLALAQGNRLYESRFGRIFIVCASGKSADEMLALLMQRVDKQPEQELINAAGEQEKIMCLRLERLCA